MEVLWNTVTVILNLHLMMVIQFHDTLHVLHTDKGTGPSSLGDKLLQHPMAMREEVLYKILEICIKPMLPWTAAAAYTSLRHT